MSTPFYSIQIRRNRELIVARQRTRHVARLLNYRREDEAALAATLFTLAANCLAQAGQVTLHFHLRPHSLVIVPEVPSPPSLAFDPGARWSSWRIERPLPETPAGTEPAAMSAEDLTWSLQTINEFAPTSLFDEIKQQNDDALELLRELRACQNELAEMKQSGVRIAAA